MYKGNVARLRMKRNLIIGETTEGMQFDCEVLSYDESDESILLVLQTGKLEDLSLNAVYQCEIYEGEEAILCTGTIVDRYCARDGEMVKIKIKNGFYKISIK